MRNEIQSNTIYPVFGIIFCTISLLVSCGGAEKNTQREFASGEPVTIRIERFERDIFSIDTGVAFEQSLKNLQLQYHPFYYTYASDILAMQGETETDSLFPSSMRMLVSYQPFRSLLAATDSVYHDVLYEEKLLSQAMSIYKNQFPRAEIPRFVSFISEFGYANITMENLLGIGIDMYMYPRFLDFYKGLEFPDFMIRKLRREYLVPNTIKALAVSQYENQGTNDKRFLAMMINEGKVRYFMKALLPGVSDTLIFGYTGTQMQWCFENEAQMWAHYVDKDLLYNQEQSDYIRYFNDGPFTVADGVPAESAPAIGAFTGYRMVRQYMEEHPEVTLQQLMDDTRYDVILKSSKYRPK